MENQSDKRQRSLDFQDLRGHKITKFNTPTDETTVECPETTKLPIQSLKRSLKSETKSGGLKINKI